MKVHVIVKIWKGFPSEGGPEVFTNAKAADARLIELVNETYEGAKVKTIAQAIQECHRRREAGEDDELFYYSPITVEDVKAAKRSVRKCSAKKRGESYAKK